MKIIQISDLHLVAPGETVHRLDPLARLRAAIDDINRHHADAALVVASGDLADRGQPSAYRALAEVLETLVPPYRLMIGNHDDRAAFRAAFPGAPGDRAGFVQGRVETPAGWVVLLDTVADGAGHRGAYCKRRAAWLAETLAAIDDGRPRYLFLHHPPFAIGIPALDKIRLLEPEAFIRALNGARPPRHMFFGHVHRPVAGSWRGIPWSAVKSLAHQIALEFTSAERMPYSHDAPGYAVILLEEESVTVHFHDFLDQRPLQDSR